MYSSAAHSHATPQVNPDNAFRTNFMRYVVKTDESQPADMLLQTHLGGQYNSLAAKQEAAVKLYSSNKVYAQMNRALRDDSAAGLQAFGGLVNLTMSPFSLQAMRQKASEPLLKPFVGKVWRACTLSEPEQATYQVGGVITWQAFSSTSMRPNSWPGNTIFEIHCSKTLEAKLVLGLEDDFHVPASIRHLSQFSSESEVLYHRAAARSARRQTVDSGA